MVRNKIDYGKNKLTIREYPEVRVFPNGDYVGMPCIEIEMGTEIELTNEKLRDYINVEFPLTPHVSFVSDVKDPTLFSNELWSFIKYYNKNSNKRPMWHLTTTGERYIAKFLYELDDILIDIQTPSYGETPPEFISWCCEDKFITSKVQFLFKVFPKAVDITYARTELVNLESLFNKNTTIQLVGDWRSYREFMVEFMATMRYPNVRLLPNMQTVLGVGKR